MNIRIYLTLATLGCVSIAAHSADNHTPPQRNTPQRDTCEGAAIRQMWDEMLKAGQHNSNNFPDTSEATKIAFAFEKAMEQCKKNSK